MVMNRAARYENNDAAILSKAFLNTQTALGLTKEELGRVIGKDRTSLRRDIDPKSKSGELALMFIRIYRGLYALMGGDSEDMKHWMHTENRHTRGIPAKQVQKAQGLNYVLEYLDAMRGKV